MKESVSFSPDGINVFFHILTRCNLNCRHCYINPEQHGGNTLSLATIAAWLKIFAGKSKAANIIFLGGEPTLHPKLSQAIKTAKHLGYTSITVDTNGYLFNDILSKVHPDDVDYLSFSLDGATKKTNDLIRGKGAYDTCIAGIRQAVSRGFTTGLIYTVSRTNIGEVGLLPPLLKELGIDRLFIQVIGLRGKPAIKNRHKHQVSKSEWLDKIPTIAKKTARLGKVVHYPKVFLNSAEPFRCAGLMGENFIIFPNGRVYHCPLCGDFPFHSLYIEDKQLIKTARINEKDFFQLNIPEGCVMNKLIQPENLCYNEDGSPKHKIGCCMLKVEISY
jgi:MoaA/NifB/PqqE/SkfB family radical SAM enzyme